MAGIESMNLESKDLVATRIEQLKNLFPDIVTEGSGSVDFEKLRLALGDEVDEGDERYDFTWPGKRDAIRQAQISSSETLRPVVGESRSREGDDGSFDSDNIYIEGDNLEVLKLLQHSYHNKVKAIYIDPPYNTGEDFVYKDRFGDTIGNYKEQSGATGQSNANTSGRFHSNWCSMMYPRLKLGFELLKDEGAVFISIDDHELCNMLMLANQVFSERNFVGVLPRITKKSGKNHSSTIAKNHDYILVYARNIDALVLNGLETGDKGFDNEDEFVNERGRYKINQTLDYNSLWYNPKMDYPLEVDGVEYYPGGDKNLHLERHAGNHTPKDWVWRWSMPKFEFGVQNGFVEIKQGNDRPRIYTKTYKNASIEKDANGNYFIKSIDRLSNMSSLEFTDNAYSNDNAKKNLDLVNLGSEFDFSKPISLVEQILELMPLDDGDIVLDYFAGSSTTAAAVMDYEKKYAIQLKFILVQLPEELKASSFSTICEIGKERIRRVGTKIAAEIEDSNKQLKLGEDPKPIPDIGFRVFKLDESGINKQDLNAAAERGKLFGGDSLLDSVVKPSRSDIDIIFEMMLKWGLDLTLPVAEVSVEDYKCYQVAGGELVCCMEAGLTVAVLETIARMDPRRVLMLDSILTDTLKLNAVQIFKRVGDHTGVEVELRTV